MWSLSDVEIEPIGHLPLAKRRMEYVERKGLGHPDSICDSVMESISIALSKEYLNATGYVLHHNLDKGLLVAGQTSPKLGGGTVDAPMRLIVGDRATNAYGGKQFPIQDIVVSTTRHWFRKHLRFVDPDAHLIVQNELKSGAAELVAIYNPTAANASSPSQRYVANDTSVGVGFAPLSEAEHLVLAAEQYLNSADFKHDFPETGEDVKVMGVRHGRRLFLTVAVAFVDRFIWESKTYFHRKTAAQMALQQFVQTKLHQIDSVEVQINALDNESRGFDGMYLTVLGTSAESGDGGEVGRGNRVNGLISFCRPMTTEAAAGKNPVSHVGKVYNVLAHRIAEQIHLSVGGVEEIYVWLCSQIGSPIDQPFSVSAQIALAKDASLSDVEGPIRELIGAELADIVTFSERLTRGEFPVC